VENKVVDDEESDEHGRVVEVFLPVDHTVELHSTEDVDSRVENSSEETCKSQYLEVFQPDGEFVGERNRQYALDDNVHRVGHEIEIEASPELVGPHIQHQIPQNEDYSQECPGDSEQPEINGPSEVADELPDVGDLVLPFRVVLGKLILDFSSDFSNVLCDLLLLGFDEVVESVGILDEGIARHLTVHHHRDDFHSFVDREKLLDGRHQVVYL